MDYWFRASERVWDSPHIHLQWAVWRHKDFAGDRCSITPVYSPGDKVWLSTRDLSFRLPCMKGSPRYIGPFSIQREINEVTYLELEGYGPEERSWVARDDIQDPSLLVDFHRNHRNFPAPRGHVRP